MRITSKEQCKDGMRVKWKHDDIHTEDAMLSLEDGLIYICQDVLEGSPCTNMHGYKYSWSTTNLNSNKLYTVDKPVKTKPKHLGYEWDGVKYTQEGIDNMSIAECRKQHEFYKEKLNIGRKRMRRWESLNKKGWK